MKIAGPLAGAGIYAAWGGQAVVLADIATFAFSVVCYLAMRRVPDIPATRKAAADSGAATGDGHALGLLAGVRHILAVPVIRQLVLASAVAFTGAGMIDVAMFSLVSSGLHRPAALIGVITSVEGAGSAAAGFLIGATIKRTGRVSRRLRGLPAQRGQRRALPRCPVSSWDRL